MCCNCKCLGYACVPNPAATIAAAAVSAASASAVCVCLLPPPGLQVEHGITEMVNGFVDIVEWMLRLQLGHFMAPLDFDVLDKEIKRSGWSIEVGVGLGGWGKHVCACMCVSGGGRGPS